ncbi:MAG: patatin-like phospholipase family protein [Chitinophagaceae bacterium]|nr:MAG: patatin-like phospholipase family protein [Chitinophagaceae bacterium]
MKKALVISGGGSKGAFSVGVLKSLQTWDFHADFDIYVGTSTGSLIIPLAAMGAIDQLEKLYTNYQTKDILQKGNVGNLALTNSISIFGFAPLKSILEEIYDDEFFDELNQSNKEIYLTTVCLQTQEIVVFTNAKNPVQGSYYRIETLKDGAQFRAAVLASASQPVFTPPVKINEKISGSPHANFQYVDGGVREYAGVMIAVEAGADNILTIIHSSQMKPVQQIVFKNMFEVLQQTLELFLTDVGENDMYVPRLFNNGLEYIDQVKEKMRSAGVSDALIDSYFNIDHNNLYQNRKPIRMHLIRPLQLLSGGPGGLVFDPAEMKNMLVAGETSFLTYAAHFTTDNFWA